MAYFVGRTSEQQQFRDVLAELRPRRFLRGEPTGEDKGHVVLVHGLGGIGKTSLVDRYEAIAGGETDPELKGRFLVAKVDWSDKRKLDPAYHSTAGPPVWLVADRLYAALQDAVGRSRWARRRLRRAFAPFRSAVTQLRELDDEARRLGLADGPGRGRLPSRNGQPRRRSWPP
jgi:hypothetical protein